MKPSTVKKLLEKYPKLYIGTNHGETPTRWYINSGLQRVAETDLEDFAQLIQYAIEKLREESLEEAK
jgi:hypothetical protein